MSSLFNPLLKADSGNRKFVADLFAYADIEINGSRPWDIQVSNDRFFSRLLSGGSLALGESFMEGWWDCEDLSQFFTQVLRAKLDERVSPWTYFLESSKAKLLNRQSRKRAFLGGGAQHYNLGNDFYQCMLDAEMLYTCGYWKNASHLDDAQISKMKLVCEKLGLAPGMSVLDIGCGWGGFLRYAAKHYGIQGVGVTISREQARLACERCQGLDIEIKLQDYRELDGTFDRIVSLGMFEHVGQKNYKAYMKTAAKCLKPDGLFLLHTIGGNKSDKFNDPWIDKHIFPDSMLPSIAQIGQAIEADFVMEDWHNFGSDYDKTLLAWFSNFDRNWAGFSDRLGDLFYRKWQYYLLSCAGSFRARKNQLWQIILSKSGVPGGYSSVR